MIRRWIVVLFVSFIPFQVAGQIPNIKETRIQVPPSSDGPGGWYDEIENLTSTTIMALHATFSCPTIAPNPAQKTAFEFDALFAYGGRRRPIPAGASQRFFLQPWAADCAGGVDAVVFADGHSNGSTQLVEEIYKKRLGAYEALTIVHKLLGNAPNTAIDPNVIANDLAARTQSVSHNMALDPMERLGQMSVFTLASSLLRSQSDLHVPSDDTVRAQPGIEATMKLRNMPRQQAHALVVDNKLSEWSRELGKYLQPAP
jgi:hypothetical protein